MASDKHLKFYKGAATPAAAIGSVWFDTENRLIRVRVAESGNDQWESYSGLQNATWIEASKSLELTKADGSKLTINLSDVASASDLTKLTARVSTNEIAIANNKTAADTGIQEAKDAAAAVATDLSEYETSNDARVKAVEDDLSGYKTSNDARVGSVEGNVSTLQTTVGTHGEAITALQQAVGEGGSVDAQIDSKIAELDATVGSQSIAEGKHVAVEVVEVDGKLTGLTVTENFGDITKAISDEVTRATNAEAAIAARLNDGGDVASAIATAQAAAEAAQADIDAFMEGEAIEGSTIDTLKEIQAWITADESGSAVLVNRVSTNESNIATLQGKVDVEKVSTAISTAMGEAVTESNAYADGLIEDEVERAEAAYEKIGVAAGLVNELAGGQVATNTAALATVDSRIATAKSEAIAVVKGDAADYDTLGKVEAKLDAIDEALARADATAVKSVSGTGYVEATGGQNPVISVKTGAVADGGDVLTTAASVKNYVEEQVANSWLWEEF